MKTSKKNLTVKIDWLSMIFTSISYETVIEQILQVEGNWVEAIGKHVRHKKYDTCYECGEMVLFTTKYPQETCDYESYLVLSGEGCSQFEKMLAFQNRTWQSFFADCEKIIPNDYFVTRLDIAIDDRNLQPFFTVEQLHKKCLREEYDSTSVSYHYNEKSFAEFDTSKTLYIGSNKSEVSYRIYDKDKEQSMKKSIPIEEIGSWKRTEIVLRDTKSYLMARNIALGHIELGQLAFNFLSEHLNFITRTISDEEEPKICRFWQRFLGEVQPLKLKMSKESNSLLETQQWMKDGGVLSAIKAFEFLEVHQALGNLDTLDKMKQQTKYSEALSAKLVSHLIQVGKDDLVEKVYQDTKNRVLTKETDFSH